MSRIQPSIEEYLLAGVFACWIFSLIFVVGTEGLIVSYLLLLLIFSVLFSFLLGYYKARIFSAFIFIFSFFVLFYCFQKVANEVKSLPGVKILNSLGRIAEAMVKYHEKHGHFPAHAVFAPDGRALYSWRVELLPFLGHEDLYRVFRLDQPWDSPENFKLLPLMPEVYKGPSLHFDESDSQTCFQVFVGPGAAFEANKKLSVDHDFPDGVASTILLVETFESVPWTKPVDIPFGPDRAFPLFGEYRFSRVRFFPWNNPADPPWNFFAAMADGKLSHFTNPPDPERFKALVTRNGGEVGVEE